jgi:DNA-directed RNA polymerase subunit H (RpoH/RPB5)
MADFYEIYFEARRVCLKMMADRGYQIAAEHLIPMTAQEYGIMYEKDQINLGEITDNEGRPTYVKFIKDSVPFNKTIDKAQVFSKIAKYFQTAGFPQMTDDKLLVEKLKEGTIRVIIIYNAMNQANKYEEDYIADPYIEVHQVQNMAIDPTAHKYQPKWKLMTDQEDIAKVLRKYDAQPIMFGSIAIDDPINRYYRGRPAENSKLANLYEVTRGGVNIFYRRVISKRMNVK